MLNLDKQYDSKWCVRHFTLVCKYKIARLLIYIEDLTYDMCLGIIEFIKRFGGKSCFCSNK